MKAVKSYYVFYLPTFTRNGVIDLLDQPDRSVAYHIYLFALARLLFFAS